MSASAMTEKEWWEIVFAYPGKTVNHWQPILSFYGTRREAEKQAEEIYPSEAVDFYTIPISERP